MHVKYRTSVQLYTMGQRERDYFIFIFVGLLNAKVKIVMGSLARIDEWRSYNRNTVQL